MEGLRTSIVYFLLHVPIQTKSDKLLSNFHIFRQSMEQAPKHWHTYITKYLAKNLHLQTNHDIQNFLLFGLKSSEVFHQFSRQRAKFMMSRAGLNRYANRYICYMYLVPPRKSHCFLFRNNTVHFYSKQTIVLNQTYNTNVELSSGTFELYHELTCGHKVESTLLSWIFQPDDHLALNLTFNFIRLSMMNKDCSTLHFSLKTESRNPRRFVFCGQFSVFNFYPPSQHVNMELTSKLPCQIIAIYGQFQMFDKISIYNVHWNRKVSSNFYHSFAIYLPQKHVAFTMWIKTSPRLFIRLQFSGNIAVFDGPDFQSRLIWPKENIFSCTTHQCTIGLLVSANFSLSAVNYFGEPVKVDKQIMLKKDRTVSFALRSETTNQSTTNTLVSVSLPLQVNATIIKIQTTGEHLDTCSFAGVFTFSSFANKTRESPSLCHNSSFKSNFSRSFYSVNSSLHLLLYWRKMQSGIEADFLLGITNCNSVFICVCKQNNFEQLNTGIALLCDDYNSAIKTTNFTTEKQMGLTVLFHSWNAQACTIFQLVSYYERENAAKVLDKTLATDKFCSFANMRFCKLRIAPDAAVMSGIALQVLERFCFSRQQYIVIK